MRLRFWPTRDERIADLRKKLRAAQQHAVRLKFGNQELARTNVQLTGELAKAQRERQIALAQRTAAWDALEAQGDALQRVAELEQTVVAMGAEAVKGVARGVLDEAWPDVAAVAGPEASTQ